MMDEIKIIEMDKPPSHMPSEDVVALVIKTFKEDPWNIDYSVEEARRLLQPTYDVGKFCGIFAYKDGELKAFATASSEISKEGAPYLWIWSLCVDPSVHGKGIGSELTQRIINKAVEQGVESVRLGTLKDGPAARLYVRMGFQELPAKNPNRVEMRLNLKQCSQTPNA